MKPLFISLLLCLAALSNSCDTHRRPQFSKRVVNEIDGAVLVKGGEYHLNNLRQAPVNAAISVRDFFIKRDLVSVDEFVLFLNDQPTDTTARFFYGKTPHIILLDGKYRVEDNRKGVLPVQNVSWIGACNYCAWLSDEEYLYRLPTELEWEYMASNGGTTVYPWGNDRSIGIKHSDPISIGGVFLFNLPVGSLAENTNMWGVRDLIGSVPQWCADVSLRSYEDRNSSWLLTNQELSNDLDCGKISNIGSVERVLKGGINAPSSNFYLNDAGELPTAQHRIHEVESPNSSIEPYIYGFRWVRESRGVPSK